ncbi:transcriptional regulator GcvA [Pelagibius sp. Alg239-R121]|uniref:transcriptional regulator GcvA n=1 Tax=Pelagibius sp. Alg239-R121 TaxID=2993448 RepID=UPI0024A61C80|nr:transcriptional regulator GcvA [Pelagibius sp. Alg239-R121]
MMNRSNLPLNALRAFEASARHLSFSKAAEELCVTHSAVSQQIKQLEDLLGLQLFHRTNSGVQLTEAGHRLLPLLIEFFDRIGETLDELIKGPRENTVNVTTTPTFAVKWLMPRLRRWHMEHEDQSIHLVPTLRMLELGRGKADIGIRCGLPPWRGLKSDLILPIHMTPVCSPTLLEESKPLDAPQDVLNYPLLHADVGSHERGEEWRTWLAAAKVTNFKSIDGLSFHDPGLSLQAAIDGMGIAIGYTELAEPDLRSGRLIQPFELTVRHSFSYYIVYPEYRQDDPQIQAFRDWLIWEKEKPL